MKTLDEIRDILNREKQTLVEQFKIKGLSIFGSFVRGESQENSDLDVLVEFYAPIGFFQFLDLEEHLQNLLEVKIDLVSKKALKPKIGERILKEAVPI